MKRTGIMLAGLMGLVGCGTGRGACVLYGESAEGGRYGCQERMIEDCDLEEGEQFGEQAYHDGETCKSLGFDDPCGGNGAWLYRAGDCPAGDSG